MMFRQILKDKLPLLASKIEDSCIEAIGDFHDILLDYNKKVNLTRITSPEDFALKHVIDSLIIFDYIDIPQGSTIIDVGSGPGIPGLLLKLYRDDLQVSLLESVKKKTRFLSLAVDKLGLKGVEIINDRAETAGQDPFFRSKFDFAVARAVSNLSTITELCIPFVKTQGLFIAMKGPEAHQEIPQASNALKTLTSTLEDQWDYKIGEDMDRSLLTIRKSGKTPGKYPRRPGMPAKRPL